MRIGARWSHEIKLNDNEVINLISPIKNIKSRVGQARTLEIPEVASGA